MRSCVQLKGTRSGVVLTVSEECTFEQALSQMEEVVASQAALLGASPLSIDFGWRDVSEVQLEALCAVLTAHGSSLLGVISSSLTTRRLCEAKGYKTIIGVLGLARHGGRARVRSAAADTEATDPVDELEVESELEPPPDPYAGSEPTLVLRKNLRSGQRVQFPGHVLVFGDVNHGAEIVAGGDVVVLGHVRGTVHAGAEGNEGARVVALNLHAPQVRIADHLGLVEPRKQHQGNVAVVSTVVGGQVATSLIGGGG